MTGIGSPWGKGFELPTLLPSEPWFSSEADAGAEDGCWWLWDVGKVSGRSFPSMYCNEFMSAGVISCLRFASTLE